MAYVALILYILPILVCLRHYIDMREAVLDWMRESGNWYPSVADMMCGVTMIFWPVVAVFLLAPDTASSR